MKEITPPALGVVVAVLGLLLSYNLFASPENRIGGHALGALMFLGPVVLAIGLVVLWRTGNTSSPTGSAPAAVRPKFLLRLGLALLAISAALLVHSLVTGSEITGFLFTISFFVLALPGLVLVAVGINRARRRPGS